MVRGVDSNLSPYSLFTKVSLKGKGSKAGEETLMKKEPFETLMVKEYETIDITLHFKGHYGEPKYKVEVDMKELKENNNLLSYLMVYDPFEGLWEFCVPI